MLSSFTVVVAVIFSLVGSISSLEVPVSVTGYMENFGSITPRSEAQIFRNLDYEQIFQHEIADGNIVTSSGSVAIDTGRFTGRSPKDKYIVKQKPSEDNVSLVATFSSFACS